MRDDDYDYDYHNLAENADELCGDEYYYDDGSDEPWADDTTKNLIEDEYREYMNKYNAYYHDVADEIDDQPSPLNGCRLVGQVISLHSFLSSTFESYHPFL